MPLTFKVKNAAGVAASLANFEPAVIRRVQIVMASGARRVQARTEIAAPRDTGFMADHVRVQMSAKGLAFQVGWDSSDFAASQSGEFYPPHVEYGTGWTAAQPSLGPSFEIEQPRIKREVATAIRMASEDIIDLSVK